MAGRSVFQYELNGEYVTKHPSITAAAKVMGCNESTIRTALGRKNNKACGFKWTNIETKFLNYSGTPGIIENLIKYGTEYDHRDVAFKKDNVLKPGTIYYTKDGEFINEGVKTEEADKEVLSENVRLAKQKQKYQDFNRIERKSFREHARIENTLEELYKALINKFNEVNLNYINYHYDTKNKKGTFIVQLSDLHLNELIELPYNTYDFIEASKRLMKYAHDIKLQALIYNPKKIVIALTGDILNSDRRLDEIINKATNRAKASLIATSLIGYFISDLLQIAPIDICMVSGNESRINEEFGYTDEVISDNYDVLVFNMLKLTFKNTKNVHFLDGDVVEQVISVNNVNFLILHGTTIKSDSQAGIQQIIGKYMAKNIIVHYVLFGHVHFANITDIYARSGSLCGGNTYSDYGINLITKASQNLHIVEEDGSIKNIRCELHNTKDIIGYPIKDDLNAYHAKSADKLRSKTTVLQIVI